MNTSYQADLDQSVMKYNWFGTRGFFVYFISTIVFLSQSLVFISPKAISEANVTYNKSELNVGLNK